MHELSPLIFDQSAIDYLAEIGFKPEFGARELRRQIRTHVESRLAEAMLGEGVGEGDTVVLAYRDGEVTLDRESAKVAASVI